MSIAAASLFGRWRAVTQTALQQPTILKSPGNQGKHRVTKRKAALSNPMFTLVTSVKVKKTKQYILTYRCTFKLLIEFSEEYPNKPPTVRFASKMFHPNVYADGSICLDILQNRWSPTYDVSSILTSIQKTDFSHSGSMHTWCDDTLGWKSYHGALQPLQCHLSLYLMNPEPNPNSPANSQAAQLYQENKREYEKRVSAIVEQSWNDS
ncbi:unnamed protein product [Ranitomeya imitator]|uniref:UBC core domain-containing protein n=1 Tax=Ranitomeya imitator TaxID=111125 RepID=A0ABN9LZA0_9NEOB|nr:unnamed protein product [Ranitomeya imitator]